MKAKMKVKGPIMVVYCDYKRTCKNKGSQCRNCERNYENEIWEARSSLSEKGIVENSS